MPADPNADNATIPAAPEDMGPLGPKGVKALKIAVVVMGIMIFAGLALIVGRIIYLASAPAKQQMQRASTSLATDHSLPSSVRLPLPEGAVIGQTSLFGSQLLVRYKTQEGREHISIFDLKAGKKVSDIEFAPQPAP